MLTARSLSARQHSRVLRRTVRKYQPSPVIARRRRCVDPAVSNLEQQSLVTGSNTAGVHAWLAVTRLGLAMLKAFYICRVTVAFMTTQSSNQAKARILVLHNPDAPELKILDKLPEGACIVGVGRALADLHGTGYPWSLQRTSPTLER